LPFFQTAQEQRPLKGHVLLVEDNLINQRVAQEILQKAGLIITTAANGQEATQKVETTPFDLVLMDIDMPVMDGYEAATIIRRQYSLTRLPIVAMTANTSPAHREKRIAAGMNNYISKPINVSILYQLLAEFLPETAAHATQPTAGDTSKLMQLANHADILPKAIGGIDLNAGLARLQQNHTLYRKLLLKFYYGHRNTSGNIEIALSEGNTDNARHIVHAIIGVAGNLGMTALFNAGKNLETALQRRETRPRSLATFQQELGLIMSGLAQLKAHPANHKAKPEFDAAALAPLLETLAGYLDEGNLRALDLLPTIKTYLGGTMPAQIDKLGGQINNFAFEDASLTLLSIANGLKEKPLFIKGII